MDKNLFRRGDKLCDKGLDKLSVCAQVERSKYYALPLTLSFFIFTVICNTVRWATYLRSRKFRKIGIEIIILRYVQMTL